MFMGLPVALAFFLANVVGTYIFGGGMAGLSVMPMEFVFAVGKFSLVPIVLFILMGEILLHTGIAYRAIGAIDRLISRMPGRLNVVAICGGTVFSSLSGSTIANTAILGSVLLPDMIKRGYNAEFSMGPIMAVGGIAMLIPPSALAVLLASLAEFSIKEVLMAGIIPGILMALLFVAYVIIRAYFQPSLAPVYDDEQPQEGNRWRGLVVDVLPLLLIFVVVVGSIFFRLASPTEASALGCLASFILCLAYRAITWENLMITLQETAKVSGMILFIIAGSLTFSQILQVSGATQGLLQWITSFDLSALGLIILMVCVLLFLGAFMDQISMMLLTLPFFLPLAMQAQIDILWLLVLVLITMEVSLLTPPFGLLLYVMKGIAPANISLMSIYRAALPYLALELVVLGLLVIWPEIATWLPSQLK
jgi:tripartite ATP-independent transporter DctM subunit